MAEANSDIQYFPLYLIREGTGKGGIHLVPHDRRFDCDYIYNIYLSCAMQVASGVNLSIEAVPYEDSSFLSNEQNTFAGWKSGPCAGTKLNPCTFTTLNKETIIAAEFKSNDLTGEKYLSAAFLTEENLKYAFYGKILIRIDEDYGYHDYECGIFIGGGLTGDCHQRVVTPLFTPPQITLKAIASEGYLFDSWLYGPDECKADKTGVCTFTFREHTQVIAKFKISPTIETIPLTLSINGMGSIRGPRPKQDGSFDLANELLVESESEYSTLPQSFHYQSDSEVSLQAKPKEGWYFNGWSGACSGNGGCIVTMTEAKTVTATFTKNSSYTLNVSKIGLGAVTSTPEGLGCIVPASCAASYNAGTEVSLQASPATGYYFAGWGGACSGMEKCTLTMDASKSVTATFKENTTASNYTLTVSKTGNGRIYDFFAFIDCGPRCSTSFGKETEVTLHVDPAAGFHFDSWGGACATAGSVPSCTVTINAATTVTAHFTKNTSGGGKPVMMLRKVGTGIGSVNVSLRPYPWCDSNKSFCTMTYDEEGRIVSIYATEEPGSIFAGWRTGPCAGSRSPDCKLSIGQGNTYIEAAFDRDPHMNYVCAARYFSTLEERILDAFIAFYGRPADVGGLRFWKDKLSLVGGDISAIMASFADSDEYKDRFGDMSDRDLVNNLFMQLFARPGDFKGDTALDWYTNELNKGTFTLASMA